MLRWLKWSRTPTLLYSRPTIQFVGQSSSPFFLPFLKKIYFTEKERVQGGRAESKGERNSSMTAGLDLTTPRARPEPKPRVGSSTPCATQAPIPFFIPAFDVREKDAPKCQYGYFISSLMTVEIFLK